MSSVPSRPEPAAVEHVVTDLAIIRVATKAETLRKSRSLDAAI
jgi:hypothetical protein